MGNCLVRECASFPNEASRAAIPRSVLTPASIIRHAGIADVIFCSHPTKGFFSISDAGTIGSGRAGAIDYLSYTAERIAREIPFSFPFTLSVQHSLWLSTCSLLSTWSSDSFRSSAPVPGLVRLQLVVRCRRASGVDRCSYVTCNAHRMGA